MNQEEKFQPAYEEVDLIDYVKIIIKKWWLIISVSLIVVAVAGVWSFLTPKLYRIDTVLEIGGFDNSLIENPAQLVEKLKVGTYKIIVMDKLNIVERDYPEVKITNPKDTSLIIREIESDNTQRAVLVLEEVNKLILGDHQEKIKNKKELIEKNIKLLEQNIEVAKNDIERIKVKIGFLEEEKNNLEEKIDTLQKILPYQQDPGTQFALFDTKEKLASKKQEIEDSYLKINSLEEKINSIKNQINSPSMQIEQIKPTKVIKSPTISENPIKPKPLLNIVIAAFLGLFVGILIAFLKEWWERNKTKV